MELMSFTEKSCSVHERLPGGYEYALGTLTEKPALVPGNALTSYVISGMSLPN